MDILPIVVAGAAAARDPPHLPGPRRQLAGRPGPGAPDPARDDAGQEPRGARAPAAVPRADAAPACGPALRLRRARRRAPRSAIAPRSAWRWPATRATSASRDWLGIKAIGAIVLAVLFFLLFGILGSWASIDAASPSCPVGADVRLHRRRSSGSVAGSRSARRRSSCMIPDALDLLTISVRAGLGFDAALGKVVEKLKGPLTDEFRRALAEVRVGKARRDALRDIVPRTEVVATDELHRRDHPGRAARRVDLARCSRSSRSSSASSAGSAPRRGGQGADQDALPARRVHLPVAVHRHPRPGDHPDRPEPGDLIPRFEAVSRVIGRVIA